jgi:hypothetical protein
MIKRLSILLITVAFCFMFSADSFGLSPQDWQSLQSDSLYYESCINSTATGGSLPAIIPEPYNAAFTQGANNHNVAPALIAAIFTEENFTDSQTSQLAQIWASFPTQHPDPNSGWPTNQYNTEGAFQFIPSTWQEYGEGGDPQNIVDAANAAANYLASNGATLDRPPASWANAIFDYNHAQWYVDAVLVYYNFYSGGAVSTAVSSTPPTSDVSSSACSESVSCVGSFSGGVADLSTIRQQIVCVVQQELALWQSGQLKPNTNAYYKYSEGRNEEWCADFASWVYNQAGYPLGPAGSLTGNWNVDAVVNMLIPPQSASKFTFHSLKDGYTPVPGDLAIHEDVGTNQHHVNIVVAVSGSTVTLVGGDQGPGPYNNNSVSEYSIDQSDFGDDAPPIIGFLSPE